MPSKRGHMPQLPCLWLPPICVVTVILIRAALSLHSDDSFFSACQYFPVFSFIFFSPQLKPWEEPSSSALATQLAIWPPNQTEMFSCKTFTLLRVPFSQGTVLTYMYRASHSTDVMCGCHLLTIQTLRYNGPVPNVNSSVVFWHKLV